METTTQPVLMILKTRDVKIPTRGTSTSSGIDFFIPEDLENLALTPIGNTFMETQQLVWNGFEIIPWMGVLIPTGIKTIIRPGFDLVFDNKSGIATKKGLVIGAKVIDSDYRGEIHIHLINTSNEKQYVYRGDKVAQAILRQVSLDFPLEIFEEQFKMFADTERGEGGFGSTGTK